MNFDSLKKDLEGDITNDATTLMLYASDASIYQQLPSAVAFPRSTHDCRVLIQFANEQDIAIIPRAGGTSLAGQVVGEHLVIDVSRYLDKVIDIDHHNNIARVQAGVVPSVLNEQLASHNLMFAPDPSTLDRCNIAGMIGNNAWGAHCPTYGTTREHVTALEILLSNGEHLACTDVTETQFRQIQAKQDTEGHLLSVLDQIIATHRESIIDSYPAITDVPCNAGFALHSLCHMQPWQPDGNPFNLSSLICGSEGHLAFVTEATVRLTPRPLFRTMICAHFDDLQAALHSVSVARQHSANAIELLDQYLLRLTREKPSQQVNRGWIQGDPVAVLLIEFTGMQEAEVTIRSKRCMEALQREYTNTVFSVLKQAETQAAWNLRRASLGFLMGVTSTRKPVTFIEDSAVPVKHLPAFVADIQRLMDQYQLQCVYYGSVSMGLIHLRPLLDLQSDEDIAVFKQVLDNVADILRQYHGTLSAKHGDGIIRSPYIKTLLGEQIWQFHQTIKQAFDPGHRFNPGKITQTQSVDTHLRLQKPVHTGRADTFYTWQSIGGIYRSIYQCNGAGACRKLTRGSTMCPSYRATHEEIDSTRGRANVYRQVMQNFGFQEGITHPSLVTALEHCLACKACQTECPAGVDMAKLKSEQCYQYIKKFGRRKADIFIQHFETLSSIACLQPGISNRLARSRRIKSLLGLHQQRQLPKLAPYSLNRWFKRNRPHMNAEQAGTVVLLCDPFTQFYDVDVGSAAVEVLERLGYRVLLSPNLPSLRTVMSQGLLDVARDRVVDNITALSTYVEKDIPIIGLEPSEVVCYRDDIRDINISRDFNSQIHRTGEKVLLFDEFIQQNLTQIRALNLKWRLDESSIRVHGHCHQKAHMGLEPTLATLSLINNVEINSIASGCCGMAGSFGYQQENFELSIQIAELELFPAIRAANDAIIVATGTSCRQQILDGMNLPSFHTAQVLYRALLD